jgi:hypothetical protein
MICKTRITVILTVCHWHFSSSFTKHLIADSPSLSVLSPRCFDRPNSVPVKPVLHHDDEMYLQEVLNHLLGTIIDGSIVHRTVTHFHDTYVGFAVTEQFPLHFLQNLKQTQLII